MTVKLVEGIYPIATSIVKSTFRWPLGAVVPFMRLDLGPVDCSAAKGALRGKLANGLFCR